MRRALAWYLPLLAAIVAAVTFGYGFVSFVRGDTGSTADFLPAPRATSATQASVIVPLVMGDSLARGAGDETGLGIGGRLTDELRRRRIASRPSVNVAVNGAKTADLLRQLDSRNVRTLIAQSNAIIISIGGNDLWGGTDWRRSAPADPDAAMTAVLDRIDQILKIVRQSNPKARIFLIGLYNPFAATPGGPMLTALVNRWNGRLLERFGSDPNFTLVATADLFSHRERLSLDHFHPGGEGYGLIAGRIAESL
ncbi:MAG: GDSL-type esterase/lipase family protein [Acidobacteriota bacterium]